MRREGPGPGARLLRPLELVDPDFLLFLMISSRVMSRAADMFVCLFVYAEPSVNGEAATVTSEIGVTRFRTWKIREKGRRWKIRAYSKRGVWWGDDKDRCSWNYA